MKELLEARQTYEAIIPELDTRYPNVLISNLKNEKKKEFLNASNTDQVKKLHSQTCEWIKKIPNQAKQKEFLEKITKLKNCASEEEIDPIYTEISSEVFQNWKTRKKNASSLQLLISKIPSKYVRIIFRNPELSPSFIENNTSILHQHLQNYLQKLTEIDLSASQLNNLPILNIVILYMMWCKVPQKL